MIIWVASFPRSGNNLFLLTLSRVFGMTTGSVLNPDTLASQLSLDPGANLLDSLREREETVFLKTHRLAGPDEGDLAIYLVRDGRDCLVSYAHYMIEQGGTRFESRNFEEVVKRLIDRSDHPYGSWSANVRSWTERNGRTEIVHFEKLVKDPVGTVRGAVEALGVSLPEPSGKLPAFKRLQKRNPTVFRRGRSGSWRSELPRDLKRRFWRKHGAEMEKLGYSRVGFLK
jgi:hypothetical protein